MKPNNRRAFLQKSSLAAVPFLFPAIVATAIPLQAIDRQVGRKTQAPVNFISDGLMLSPQEYLQLLLEIDKTKPIQPDFYGNGGATKLLEEKFAKLTGKEKAIYLPTGTMANQLAIKLLNGNNTKVIVPENSHIFRDEADAAQSVHGLRLVPLGKDKPHFESADLVEAINSIKKNEVFNSGLGTVAIENPIRRTDGSVVPIETVKEIAAYCKENGYKMHLDGARIHLAAAYTKVPVSEYASCFDTVYISLYKYLNASGGAILCGTAELIDQIPHQIKVLGGTLFQNWNNTAMALHYLNGIEERWDKVVQAATQLITGLNGINGLSIKSLRNGTNIYNLTLAKEISLKKLTSFLDREHNIWLGRANKNGLVKFTINESLLRRSVKEIVAAWKLGIKQARE